MVGVGSDKSSARALERAARGRGRDRDLPPRRLPRPRHTRPRDRRLGRGPGRRPDRARRLHAAAQRGFVARFRNRIVNVHPALLPSFPGLDAIGQALEAGVEETGVTVHFVDEGVDTGPVILQREVPIPTDRDRGRLEQAVHAAEHELYPEAIRMIAQGRVRIGDLDESVVVSDE